MPDQSPLQMPVEQSTNPELPAAQPIEGQPSGLKHKRPTKKMLLWAGVIAVAIIITTLLSSWLWYSIQLSPVSNDSAKLIPVTIASGATPNQIAEQLESAGIIRSAAAFGVYTRLSDTRDTLQAGSYRLTPSESTPDIVGHLVNGTVDQFSITFYPGATLAEHRQVLLDAGYAAQEVDAALTATYESPLFDSKPAGTDLEGYIYGETYRFGAGASVKDILQYTFNQFAGVVTDNDLGNQFKARGLTLYQGITLASIVQREVRSQSGTSEPSSDQRQVAQVFYSRLNAGMTLGSDVTFIYAAKKLGVEPISTLDSPYNTRIRTGLPPGPIASPGLTALLATVSPSSGDYLFFVAGDDGKTYFARTLAEHESNVARYCTVECNKP